MRAILCRSFDGIDALELAELPLPQPAEGEVRVRVRAAGVNFADTLAVVGRYQEKPPLPFVPGMELAGEVDALGHGVDGLEVGDRVVAVVDHGAFAEFALARAQDVVRLPDGVDDATAAAFPITYGTALGALRWRAALKEGETLLVHGAGGGTGLAAVECGCLLGARVIATARGADRLVLARRHGAAHVLDAEDPALVHKIRELAPRGVDVAFDTVGGAMFDVSLKTIAWEGRILVIGFASGQVPQIPANILLVKNAAAIGFYWGSYRRRAPRQVRHGLEEILDGIVAGRLHPEVSQVYPLSKVPQALSDLTGRRARGKLVIRT
ncbi:Mycocerosic acid synthase-like polyketide synthase [bacterium HR40]|nr:Mycocerosic acid synthase-like polyketide synthase [bacterium HR40]